jgi:predicted TIM-barrel fold metal-dependent hydrolase
MELPMKAFVFPMALVLGMIVGCKAHDQAASQTDATAATSGPFSSQELQQFAALEPIDAHAHAFQNDPAFYALFKKLNLHMVNILVINDEGPDYKHLKTKIDNGWKFVEGSQGSAVFCTTFNPYKWSEHGYAADTNRQLDRDFARGAVAVKIWKNVGMEIKDAKGNYLLPDDPVFEPIYKDIAAHNKTLIAHLAEPDSAWKPMDPASPDYSYYQDHPLWYMNGKPNAASKQQILVARDHVLELNPKLRVVGAHLGSMEADFNQLGQHLDKYPNFAVDMAARMPYVMMQPHADAIAFITRYQDKLLYATDNEFGSEEKGPVAASGWEGTYARDWRFLATNDTVEYGGRKFQGLALPASILRKLYHDNAVKWIPGVVSAAH